jgi:hypothetical protein
LTLLSRGSVEREDLLLRGDMKSKIYSLIFGRDARVSGALALTVVLLVALGCTCGKNFDLSNLSSNSNSSGTSSNNIFGSNDDDSSSDIPSDATLKALVKSETAAFANAIQTEDFSAIYNDASDDFKNTYSESEFKDYFKDFITKKRQVVPILTKAVSADPEFAPKPSTRTEAGNTILVLNGKYSTKPVPVTFDYEFIKRGGQWKMLVLKIFLM